jgi:HAD superfamily hydrolase (TIGR01509 family)
MLFDWGQVLARWLPETVFHDVFPDPARRAWFLGEVCTPEWHYQHDLGVPMDQTIPVLQARFPDVAAEIRLWQTRFLRMITHEITGTRQLADQLRAGGVPLYLLTNMPAEVADAVLGLYGHTGLFKDIVVSGVERMAKPDPAIYALTLARISAGEGRAVAPGEVFFTDDSAANIEAARAFGFATHLFETPDGLKRALESAGLLPFSLPCQALDPTMLQGV